MSFLPSLSQCTTALPSPLAQSAGAAGNRAFFGNLDPATAFKRGINPQEINAILLGAASPPVSGGAANGGSGGVVLSPRAAQAALARAAALSPPATSVNTFAIGAVPATAKNRGNRGAAASAAKAGAGAAAKA